MLFAAFSLVMAFLLFTTVLLAEDSKKVFHVDVLDAMHLWEAMPADAKLGFANGVQATFSVFVPSLNDSEESLAKQMKVFWGAGQCAREYTSRSTATLIDAYIIAHREQASKSSLGRIAMMAILEACPPLSK
jgi:hypothetical protein